MPPNTFSKIVCSGKQTGGKNDVPSLANSYIHKKTTTVQTPLKVGYIPPENVTEESRSFQRLHLTLRKKKTHSITISYES